MAYSYADPSAPPPNYEEAIGYTSKQPFPDTAYNIGIKQQLCYVDFWPSVLQEAEKIKRTVFQKFSELIKTANHWLSDKPDVIIKNIETVDKKCACTRDVYNGAMHFTAMGSHACYIKGLRLWYAIAEKSHDSRPSGIGYFDAIPSRLNPGEKHARFEKFDSLITRVNRQLSQQPLAGKILSVDSVQLKISRDFWKATDGQILPDETSWIDEYNQHILYILRIFFEYGEAKNETIGFCDFLPNRISGRGWSEDLPTYENYNAVFNRVQQWSLRQTGIKILNIQTLDTEYEHGSGDDRLDSLKPFDYKTEDQARVNFIRVTFTRDPTTQEGCGEPVALTYRNFVPGFKGSDGGFSRFQTVPEIMHYISAWVNLTRVKVVCAEMFGPSIRRVIRQNQQAIHAMEHSGEWYYQRDSKGNRRGPYHHKLIYFLRVYFDGPYQEPDPSQLPTGPVLQEDDSCSIL